MEGNVRKEREVILILHLSAHADALFRRIRPLLRTRKAKDRESEQSSSISKHDRVASSPPLSVVRHVSRA